MVLEEERQREAIDGLITEMVTGPQEQVAPCIRNALEVRAEAVVLGGVNGCVFG
jgi:hypothetical protein